MAEGIQEEPIIIVEEDESTPSDSKAEIKETKKSSFLAKKEKAIAWLKKQKQNIIFGFALSFLIVFFAVLFNLFSIEEKAEEPKKEKEAETLQRLKENEQLKKIIQKSNIESLLAKADMLYEQGQKQEALDIFRQISLYNESISYYTLGVAMMKKDDYKNAYDAFVKSLQNKENRTASSINAAVCAKKLGLNEEFLRYINLAEASLGDETNSELYSYYYALINYYKKNPINTLASINAPSSKHYAYNENKMAAEMHLMLNDYTGSLNALSKNKDVKDSFELGLLHANIGEYQLSIDHLNTAIENNISTNEAKEAILLSYLKNSNFSKASNTINSMPKDYSFKNYPIEVFLKERLFDIDLAQEYFSNKFFFDKEKVYSLLFYFSPYKVFDAKNSLKQIEKGHIALSANDIELSKDFINTSKELSSTNANISIAIKLALNSHSSKANKIFEKLNKKFQNHDVLEYNLGLSYAQLGDYAKAYEHFRRAQFLNKENRLAGIYALFCAELSGKDTKSIEKNLVEKMRSDKESVEKVFHNTLFNIHKDNFNAMLKWLEIEKNSNPLYLITETLVADRVDKNLISIKASKELLEKFPDDIVANIVNLYIENKKTSIKKYAFHMQEFMLDKTVDFDSFFYGPNIARELYILMGQISGNLPKIKNFLENKLISEKDDTRNIIQALGLTNIYLKNFEEAFVQYNQLIDELGVTDTNTLLNASIAAIGSNHKENAIVLLNLAKMSDKSNYEARYGLGLLNQEVKNYKAAAIEYGLIKNEEYQSKYFDFKIKESGI